MIPGTRVPGPLHMQYSEYTLYTELGRRKTHDALQLA